MKTTEIDGIIAKYDNNPEKIIPIMQEINDLCGYLPDEDMQYMADKLGVTKSYAFSVASFYEFFTFEKVGKYIVAICDGTACHSNKSGKILQALYERLGVSKENPTTEDGLITVTTVSCMGACGLGPNMEINGHIFPRVTVEQAIDYVEMLLLQRGEEQ